MMIIVPNTDDKYAINSETKDVISTKSGKILKPNNRGAYAMSGAKVTYLTQKRIDAICQNTNVIMKSEPKKSAFIPLNGFPDYSIDIVNKKIYSFKSHKYIKRNDNGVYGLCVRGKPRAISQNRINSLLAVYHNTSTKKSVEVESTVSPHHITPPKFIVFDKTGKNIDIGDCITDSDVRAKVEDYILKNNTTATIYTKSYTASVKPSVIFE